MVSNMRIVPLATNRVNLASRPSRQVRQAMDTMRQAVTRFNHYASVRSHTMKRPGVVGAIGITMAAVGLFGVGSMTALVAASETAGTAKQINQIRQLPPEQRREAPKGLLAARTVGWGMTLGAGIFGTLTKLALVAPSPLVVGLAVGGFTLGLLTLGIEKIVRAVKTRSAARAVADLVRTDEDREDLSQLMEEVNLPDKGRQMIEQRIPG